MFLLLTFVLAIVLMVLSISKWKIHPFLSIMGVSFLLSLVYSIPLEEIPTLIGQTFANSFSSIGLVIILGTLIGLILDRTGAAASLAETIARKWGRKYPELSMLLMGFLVSIPVFCDSGFVILNPIRRALAQRTGTSPLTMTLALSAGLYCSHVFIPPTPGPVAAAGSLGLENQLLWIIILGIAISIPVLAAAWFFSRHIGKKCFADIDNIPTLTSIAEATQNPRPGLAASLLPILLPILLMATGTIGKVCLPEGTTLSILLQFLGKPLIALSAGLLTALSLLWQQKQSKESYTICQKSLETAGPILFITAAGGVLGGVLLRAGWVEQVFQWSDTLRSLGIFFPFIIAALLKTAIGSSTIAITTTAGIMGSFSGADSLMAALGMDTPILALLCLMAIGAGSMTVSHANDSYFWVVTKIGEVPSGQAYRSQTMLTLVLGLTSILTIAIIFYLVK